MPRISLLAAVALLALLALVTAPLRARAAEVSAPGAQLKQLADGLSFAEGPASDADGNVFFTDQPNNRILEWSVDGKLSTYMQPCGRSNGLCFDSKGNLWACADEQNQLWIIHPDKTHSMVVPDDHGRLLNGPNDVWVRPDGGVYFTDPYYKRPYWKRGPKEQPGEFVFYLSPDHRTLNPVVQDMVRPNGIIGTPDGKTLYVSDIDGHKTYRYRVGRDGSLSGKTLFCSVGSDGMTIDSAGNVYLTGNGVSIYNRGGQLVQHVPVHEAWTGNVCFGGRDRRTLFITASKGLYALRMRTRGVGSQ